MNLPLKEFLSATSKYGIGKLAPLVSNGEATMLSSFDTAVELEKPFCMTAYYREVVGFDALHTGDCSFGRYAEIERSPAHSLVLCVFFGG
jgi:hypothetical protein